MTIISTSLVLLLLWRFAEADGVVSFDISWKYNEDAAKLGITCPNNRTKCTDRQTCCKTKHNSYHCCRYPNAVCCPDKFHCCPHGSTCDTERKRCSRHIEKTNVGVEMVKDTKEWPVVEETEKIKDNDQVCPNNRTKCKDSQTCCVTKHGSYHCCKFENAVCCSDKFHCCPQDTTCDMKRHGCVISNNEMLKLIPSNTLVGKELDPNPMDITDETKLDKDQTCPNNKTKCKDTKTCCITKHGNYYCCPHKNAVCCSDKYQCCPEGTTCDLKNKKCINPSKPFGNWHQFESKIVDHLTTADETNLEKDQTCPNNKTKCKDTKTCCITKHGNYYCCPHKNAVCCSDKYQCCPEATICDLKNKKCVSSSFSVDVHEEDIDIDHPTVLEPASPIHFLNLYTDLKLEKRCPNSKLACPGHKNCCIMDGGKFGCCKFNKGVCCPDLKTCCAHGTECDVAKGKCTTNSLALVPLQ